MNQTSKLIDELVISNIPILENEECWAMRVIDEHQSAKSSNLNSQNRCSETVRPPQASNTRE